MARSHIETTLKASIVPRPSTPHPKTCIAWSHGDSQNLYYKQKYCFHRAWEHESTTTYVEYPLIKEVIYIPICGDSQALLSKIHGRSNPEKVYHSSSMSASLLRTKRHKRPSAWATQNPLPGHSIHGQVRKTLQDAPCSLLILLTKGSTNRSNERPKL